MDDFFDTLKPYAHSLSRIAIGALFFTNGGKKIFGWFGGMGPEGGSVDSIMSMMGAAGMIELVGGALFALGLFTKPVAFLLAGEMAFAYLLGHVSRGGLWWWANGGERAALYSWIFLLFSTLGAGRWSLDAMMGRGDE